MRRPLHSLRLELLERRVVLNGQGFGERPIDTPLDPPNDAPSFEDAPGHGRVFETPSGSDEDHDGIPDHALQIAPGLFHLGTAVDPTTNQVAEGYVFVTSVVQDRGEAKPEGTPGNGPGKGGGDDGDDSTPACYSYIANGAHWQVAEPYVINTTASSNIGDMSGLTTTQIVDGIESAISEWETATADVIFGSPEAADMSTPNALDFDGTNVVLFDNLGDDGTIAVTTVWSSRVGKPSNRPILEWDMQFNTYYGMGSPPATWGDATVDAGTVVDFPAVATHEFGHAAGLGHADECPDETMYPFYGWNEIKQRSLHDGDIDGITSLYGASGNLRANSGSATGGAVRASVLDRDVSDSVIDPANVETPPLDLPVPDFSLPGKAIESLVEHYRGKSGGGRNPVHHILDELTDSI